MKTLADLKRQIKPGVQIVLTDTDVLTLTPANGKHKFLNVPRTVTKVQTNGFYMATAEQLQAGKKGSFLDFPKAADVSFTEKGFIVYLYFQSASQPGQTVKEFLQYEIIEAAPCIVCGAAPGHDAGCMAMKAEG